MSSDLTLLVIAKAPEAGRVKTRLSPPCTPEQAAALAGAALADTLATVAATPARRRVLVLDGPAGPWIPRGVEVIDQIEGGLDARLAGAFAAVDGPALLVGMDTPQVRPAQLSVAGDLLTFDDVDAVLGPAFDGGWWSIGLCAPDPRAFLGVLPSTSRTGRDQLRRLRGLGLRTALLPTLRDVDTFEDARTVAAEAPESGFAAAFRRTLASFEPVGTTR